MISGYALHRQDVELLPVNTAPTWRSIHSNGMLIRTVGGAFQMLRDALRLVLVMCGARVNALHLTTSGNLAVMRDLLVLFIGKRFGVGLVYHIRFGRVPEIAIANSIEWRIMRWIMRHASQVVLIDDATFCAVRRFVPDARAVLVPNCVDVAGLPKSKSLASGVKTALFVGWVVPSKGITELVEAWARLQHADWRLHIVGPVDPSYLTELKAKIGTHNVEFLGQLPHEDAMERMASCDLFVLPSHTEGFPNVVVEAMALGRAIVATEVGAIPEMLSNEAGLLVKSHDSEALARGLKTMIDDSGLREKVGLNARAKAARLYDIEVVFNSYMQIWRSVSGSA